MRPRRTRHPGMEQQPESRYFTLSTVMYGYRSARRQWGSSYALRPRQVYEAVYVGKQHLVVKHPDRPDDVLYLPVNSPWWWQRVQLAPSDEELFTLLGGTDRPC